MCSKIFKQVSCESSRLSVLEHTRFFGPFCLVLIYKFAWMSSEASVAVTVNFQNQSQRPKDLHIPKGPLLPSEKEFNPQSTPSLDPSLRCRFGPLGQVIILGFA